MRLSKEQAAKNRALIVAAAATLFRERGFDAVAVADLMNAAGFTHGGFYNHFESKEALAAEASGHALKASRPPLEAQLASPKPNAWPAYARAYVSPAHRDHPETGCTLAALAGDVARQSADVQAAFAEHIDAIVGALTTHLARRHPEEGKAALRTRALRTWSELVGALVLARAVSGANPALSDELLAATRRGGGASGE